MNNALLVIAGLIVALFAALAGVPHLVDWNGYRGVFEEEATRILGREVRVGGAVNVRLLPAPYASFEKVRIADPTGFSGEPFFRADSLTLWLSAPPLLRGVLEANKVEVRRPVLRLALDDKGTGNWSRLAVTPGALPFVPAGVTLQSMRIRDGVLAVHAPNGRQLLRLEDFGGELAAESLEGPYKFKGSARWRGTEREIRLATSEPQPDGAVRFKAFVRAPQTDNTYTLEGRASDLRTRPRIDGELTARIAVAPHASSAPPQARPEDRPIFDARGRVEADAAQLRLKDFTMTLEQAGQPQLVTGEATLGWRKEMHLDLALASRWLDLDKISGAGHASPAETARSLMALGAVLPSETELGIGISVDQANVGGELIGGLRVELARAPGGIVVKELKAQLPGTARLDLSGAIAEANSDDHSATGFAGDISLKGASLARFAGWLGKSQIQAEARSDGPFSLQGKLGLSDSTFELADASGELAGTPLKGELRYESGKRRSLALKIEGQRIDADQLLPRGLLPAELDALIPVREPRPGAEGAPENTLPLDWINPGNLDVQFRVRADELVARGHTLRNIDADLTLERGRLAVPALRLSTADGLSLDLEGELTNLGAEPVGRLKGVLEAAQSAALPSLAKLVGLEPEADTARRLGALAPLRVAGTLSLGERAPTAADLNVDGTLHGGRVSATARVDRRPEGWSRAPADITFKAESPDVERLLGVILAARPSGAKPQPGEVFLKLVGTPAQGLVSLATVKAESLSLAYDGRVGFAGSAGTELDGRLQLASKRLDSVLPLAGLPISEAAAAVPIEGTLEVALEHGTLRLRPRGLELGGAMIGGSVELSRGAAKPLMIAGELSAGEARLSRLLALLTRGATGEADPAAPADKQSVWPEAQFDLAWADEIQGRVALRLERLEVDDGLGMTEVRAEVLLEPGGVLQTTILSKALGGAAEARARVERAAAGVNAALELRLEDARLEALATEKEGREATGAATLTLAASGQALSPAALVAALEGRGEVRLGEAELEGLAPIGIAAAADAVLAGKTAASGDALFGALRSALHSGGLKLGPREIPIEVRSGAARLEAFAMDTPEGRTSVETTVDLALLKFDSEWRIEPAAQARPRAGGRAPIPAVSVYYVGALRDLAGLEPRLSYGSFERELTVRRMEREVDELERLRKVDEERVRQERLRKDDEERVRQERVRKDDQEWMRQERQRALDGDRAKASGLGTAAPPPPAATSAIPSAAWQSTVIVPSSPRAGEPAPPAPVPARRPARAPAPSEEIMRQISPY